jgi:MFS family permease
MDKSATRKNYIVIIAVYFVANVIFMVGPALNALSKTVYANESYTSVVLISTISSLCMIPGSLLAGAILGKVKFRTMALISMGGIAICGVIPYFSQALMVVYICRGVVGFCIGIGFPLQSTLALRLFPDPAHRTRAIGFGTISLSAGSILFMIVSGALADRNATYPFLFHAIVIIPLLIVLANLKEPAPVSEDDKSTVQNSSVPLDGKLPVYAVFTAVMFAVIFFAFYPVLLNMSSVCAYENIGGATIAGILLSLYTVGNLIGGFTFELLHRILHKYVVPFGLLLWASGTACMAFGRNVPLIILGVLLSGWAVQIVWPGTVNTYGDYVPVKKQSMAIAIFVSGMNIGCFCTTYFMAGVAAATGSDNPRLPIVYGFYIVLAGAVIWAIAHCIRKDPAKRAVDR